jgi:CRP/FNR family cyclic AMP-dependent transcriptional regulator
MPTPPTRRTSVKVRRSPQENVSKGSDFDVKLFLDSTGLGKRGQQASSQRDVFGQGDPATNVVYIQQGGVRLSVVSTTGKEAVVAVLGPGDFFGEGRLARQSIRMAIATATEPTTVLMISKDEMSIDAHIVSANPDSVRTKIQDARKYVEATTCAGHT